MNKTKRIRKALKYITENLTLDISSGWITWSDGTKSIPAKDIEDALLWIEQQADQVGRKRMGLDVRLRQLGAPELFPLDNQDQT